jgi:hypothetical protein
MKLATRLLVPAVVLGLAACGSGDKSAQKPNARMDVTPSASQVKAAASRGAAPGKSAKQQAAHKADAVAKAADTPSVKRQAAKADAAATQQAGKISLPNVSIFQISDKSAYPIAGVVGAQAPFQLTFRSSDGRAHLVKIGTPKPRSLKLAAGDTPARMTFQGVKPGNYTLSVDGSKAVATLAVMDQQRFNQKPTVPAAAPKK